MKEAMNLQTETAEIPLRPLGRTGVQVSALSLGGYDLGTMADDTAAIRFDASFRSFEQQVLPELIRRGIAPFGMKSFGGDAGMVKAGAVTAQEALRYAMSLPVATTVSGIDAFAVLHQNLTVARDFVPLSDGEMQQLRERCALLAADGRFELYKTTERYEGPVGREQHGFPSPDELTA